MSTISIAPERRRILKFVPVSQARTLSLSAIIAAIAIVAAWNNPNFLSAANLMNIAVQTSYLAVFTAAQAVVLIVRGFDLSTGNTVSLVSITAALAGTFLAAGGYGDGLSIAGMLAVAALAALAVGIFNGVGVGVLRINTFVVTLGSLNICLGFASMVSNGQPIGGLPELFTWFFYGMSVFGVPAVIIWCALVLGALHVLLSRTPIGRGWYLTGSNPVAAHVAGINTRRLIFGAYILCALIAAFGALLLTARTGSGEPNLGGNLTLQGVAAAAIGGVSLRGGAGGVGAIVLGALMTTVLSVAMNMMEINGYFQQMLLGGIIIAVASADRR